MQLWDLQSDHPVQQGRTAATVSGTSKVHLESFKAHRQASGWNVFKDIFSRKQPDPKQGPLSGKNKDSGKQERLRSILATWGDGGSSFGCWIQATGGQA